MNRRVVALAKVCFAVSTFASCSSGDDVSRAALEVPPAPAGMQLTVHDGGPSCPDCELRLHPLGSFGRIEDRVLLRNVPTVEHDSRGRFYATVREARDHELVLYDPNGDIVREIGRYGRGPGEFNSIDDVIVGAGDSIWILHDRNMFSVFDSAGAVARTNRLEYPDGAKAPAFVGVGSERMVLTHQFGLDSLARPLHVYTTTGQYLGGHGPKPLGAKLLEPWLASSGTRWLSGLAGAVAWDRAGIAWLTVVNGGYRFERLDLSSPNGTGQSRELEDTRVIGVRLPDSLRGPELYMTAEEYELHHRAESMGPAPASSQRRSRESIPPAERPMEIRPSTPGRTVVKAATILTNGLLVVLLRTAAVNWQEAVMRYRPDGFTTEPGYEQKRFDTIIDVIDIASGSVLTRTRLAGDVRVTSGGMLYRPLVSDEGVISFEAFELEFINRRGR